MVDHGSEQITEQAVIHINYVPFSIISHDMQLMSVERLCFFCWNDGSNNVPLLTALGTAPGLRAPSPPLGLLCA